MHYIHIICSDKNAKLELPINYYKENFKEDFNKVLQSVLLKKQNNLKIYNQYLESLMQKRYYNLSTQF